MREGLEALLVFGGLGAALLVIASTNPIHSVFSLILVFLSSSGLLFMIEADFMALILLVVYVGAIAVLFLFVVMMLNLDLQSLHENLISYVPAAIGAGILFILSTQVVLGTLSTGVRLDEVALWVENWIRADQITVLGRYLYTVYAGYFIIASLILLVAMIGAIGLTVHPSEGIRRQDINLQLRRTIK